MSTHADAAPREQDTRSALGVFLERPTLVMLALGFSAGLPFLLIFDTLSAWLRASGLSLEVIGFFSLVTSIYSFKFLWAPLIDRARVPLLTDWLGHRRSWMLLCQALITCGLALVATTDPTRSLGWMAVFAVAVGFCGATQDIAMDAWRIEVVDTSRQGAMAAAHQWGYRVATIISGAVPLLLASTYGWNFAYATMAVMMAVGVAGVFAAPPEVRHEIRPIHTEGLAHAPLLELVEWTARLGVLLLGALVLGSGLSANATMLARASSAIGAEGAGSAVLSAWKSIWGVWLQLAAMLVGFGIIVVAAMPLPGAQTRPSRYLSAALGNPLRDFVSRYRSSAALILAMVCFYRIPDFVLNIMNPFYLDLGFSLVEIAEIRKVFGVLMTMLGIFAGGVAVARLGLIRSLVIGAFAGPLSNLLFAWMATQGHDPWALFAAIGLDNVASGFAGTCLIAYMSGLTAAGFTATQYALLSSLYAIPGRIIASQSGRIVESAAAAAERGGLLTGLKGLFDGLSPESFAMAPERSGVSPSALGSGYVVFFGYSALIGIVPIVLAILVMRRRAGEAPAPAPSP